MTANSVSSAFIPLSMLLDDIGVWPSDMLEIEGGPNILDRIGVQDVNITETETQTTAYFTIVCADEIILRLPGVSALGLVLGGNGETSSFAIEADLRYPFQVRLVDLSIKLRLSPDILKPVKKVGDSFQIDPTVPYIEMGVTGSLNFDSQGLHIEGMNELSLSPCMLGNSGIVIEASSIALALSDNSGMAEIQAAGLSANWKGIHIESATLYLPSEIPAALPDNLQMQNCFIGSGGFTGKLKINWDGSSASDDSKLFTIRQISIEFFQNSLITAQLDGMLKIPFFDSNLDAGLHLSANGLIALQVSNPTGVITVAKDNILEFKIQMIRAQIEKGVFSLTLSGGLTPKFGDFKWPTFGIDALTIDSEGHVKIEGGWIQIPQGKALNFHGFNIEISKVGFGKDEEGYNWVGFSGGVQIVEDLPLKGGVEGLKILWKSQGDYQLKISGISVAGEIKNTLTFDGKAVFINEGNDKGFKGGMSVIVDPLDGMTFNAQFIAGRYTPPGASHFNYFYLFIDVGLPLGIPLGATGLSLYGFAGLFGYNMRPARKKIENVDEEWVENADKTPGYFLRPDVGITDMKKWEKAHHHLAFGAGLTLGTGPDNGFNFATQALLVVLLPGPTLLLEGKATLVEKRSNLQEKPPLRMLAVFDKKSGTILMNIRAEYDYPRDSGDLISITASGEVYFNFNNPSAWHLYLGQETPEAKRIKAKIINLFDASAFFMIDSRRFITGGGVAFSKEWKIRPLTLKLKARIEGRMGISWMPPQAEGSLIVDGEVKLSAFGHGIGLSIGTDLSAKTPTPWHVSGKFKVKLNLPWPLPDPKATVKLEWKNEENPPYPLPLVNLGMEHLKVNETWPLEKSSIDNEGNPSNGWNNIPIVPLDAKLVLHFARPVEDRARIGKNADTAIHKDASGPYKFTYRLQKIIIEKKQNPTDINWNLYAQKGDNATADSTLSGTWQAVAENSGVKNLKLMLGVDSPFAISRNLKDNQAWLGSLTYQWPDYPCPQEIKPTFLCVDYTDLPKDTRYQPSLSHHNLIYYAGTPIRIVPCTEEGSTTTNGLTLTPPAKETAITFKDLILPPSRGKFRWKDIIFNPGTDEEGFPIEFEQAEGPSYSLTFPYSPAKKEPAVPMSLEFPDPPFTQGPDLVEITCMYQKELLLYVYDQENTLVGIAKNFPATSTPVKISVTGKGIRKIEIAGVGILLMEISYQRISVAERIPSLSNNQPVSLPWQDLTQWISFPIFQDLASPAKEARLLILFPQEMAHIELYLSKNSKGKAIPYDREGNKMTPRPFDLSRGGLNQNPILVKQDANPIYAIVISGNFTILKICMVTVEESERVKQQLDHFQYIRETLSEEWKSQIVPLLDPKSYYRLTVVTETDCEKGGSKETETFTEYAFFQTANPPGMVEPLPATPTELENKPPYPHGGMLKDLSSYVMETIPPMVAPHEQQRPFYRTYDIGVKFNEPLGVVNAMYEKNQTPLTIELFDNNDQPLLDEAGNQIALVNQWDKNRELLLTREELQWKEFLDSSGCVQVKENYTYPQPSNLYVSAKNLLLQPQTFYKAKLTAGSENRSYAVYTFTFVTSRYTRFTHHLHSFIGKAWNQMLGSQNHPVLGPEDFRQFLALVKNPTSSHTPETYQPQSEDVAFTTLLTLFHLGIRQLPECLEILLLNDGFSNYGLLLESPEPLEWERIVFSLKSSAYETEVKPSLASVQFIQANFGAMQDFNSEWIALLFTAQMDLSGWKIQKRMASESTFTDYYVFSAGQKYSEGTQLKVHSGAAPSSPVQDGDEHVYLQPSAWQFDSSGTFFRLLDPQGKTVHTYTAIPFVNSHKTVVIRNLDQSKAFIFLTDAESRFSMLPSGRYGLEFSYKKDIGNKGPLLKRKGSLQDETTTIAFNVSESLTPL